MPLPHYISITIRTEIADRINGNRKKFIEGLILDATRQVILQDKTISCYELGFDKFD